MTLCEIHRECIANFFVDTEVVCSVCFFWRQDLLTWYRYRDSVGRLTHINITVRFVSLTLDIHVSIWFPSLLPKHLSPTLHALPRLLLLRTYTWPMPMADRRITPVVFACVVFSSAFGGLSIEHLPSHMHGFFQPLWWYE